LGEATAAERLHLKLDPSWTIVWNADVSVEMVFYLFAKDVYINDQD